jgi:hypothetical protein
MSETLQQLQARRHMLILRSERLRADLANEFGEFETRFAGADRILSFARRVAAPSILLSLGGLGLGMLRGTHPFRLITRAVLLFSVVRKILTAVRSLRSSSRSRRR